MQKPLVNGSLSQTHILQIVIHVAAVVSFQLSHLLATPMQPVVLVASQNNRRTEKETRGDRQSLLKPRNAPTIWGGVPEQGCH